MDDRMTGMELEALENLPLASLERIAGELDLLATLLLVDDRDAAGWVLARAVDVFVELRRRDNEVRGMVLKIEVERSGGHLCHTVSEDEDGPGAYRCRCFCTWFGPKRQTQDQTLEDATSHQEAMQREARR
jgi:hypothetical protein